LKTEKSEMPASEREGERGRWPVYYITSVSNKKNGADHPSDSSPWRPHAENQCRIEYFFCNRSCL